MTEVVIAMAVTVVISVLAIGMLSSFSGKVSKAEGIKKASSIANATREAFMFAETKEEFEDLLPVVCDIETTKTDGSDVYVFNEPNYNGYFIASYPETGTDGKSLGGEALYSIVIKDMNNKVVISLEDLVRTIPASSEDNKSSDNGDNNGDNNNSDNNNETGD